MKSFFTAMILAIILSVHIDISCAKQSEWRGKIEVINGVPLINNPREPIYQGMVLSLENPLQIGKAAGKEEYMFQEIRAIEVDDAERIYISDWKESHIKIFDKNGVYLKTVGRRGQGPGEFQKINRLQIINHNQLSVFDGNLKRLSVFSLDGDFEKSIPIQKMSPLDVGIGSNGYFLVKTVHLDPVSAKAGIAVNLYDPEFNLIKVLDADKPQDVLTPFQPYFVWALLTNNDILLGNNERYSFSLYDPRGEKIRTINKDYKPIPISDGEKKIRLKNLQQSPNKNVPSYYPAYQGITIDGEKRIIVQTWEKPKQGSGYCYDVFNIDGKFVASIILKYPPRLWKNDRLYTIEEDEEGMPQVVRYTVVWKF
jgi:hypothetical protein